MCVQNKRGGGLLFQFIELPFVIREMRVQNKWSAAFQFIKLLFVIQKLVCSKQAGCFFVKRQMYVQNKREVAF